MFSIKPRPQYMKESGDQRGQCINSWFGFLKVATCPILSPEIISTLTGGSGFPNPGDTDFVTSGAFTAEEHDGNTWTFNRRDGYFLSPFYILGLENTQTTPPPTDNQMMVLVIIGGAAAGVVLLVIVYFIKNRQPT
ncbi:MAG: hypothetical protein GF411_06345 [Candidatus Lokiarchaeota archaeon]|nr:hypothetical protein [Candidatus Lokiarchaeota archaeon]